MIATVSVSHANRLARQSYSRRSASLSSIVADLVSNPSETSAVFRNAAYRNRDQRGDLRSAQIVEGLPKFIRQVLA